MMVAMLDSTEENLPTVSVVIPVYNAVSTIKEAIDSVLAQTYPADEIIVVDDGSTDGTLEIARSYGDLVSVIEQENSGHAKARNTGIGAATGEFIAMLDADDFWRTDKLAKQLEVSANYDVIYTGAQNIGDSDHVDKFTFSDGICISGDHLCPLMLRNFITHSSVLIRREALLRVGGYDTSFYTSPDWDLWLRMAHEEMRFHCIPDPVTLYRWLPDSNSRRYNRATKDRLRVLTNGIDRSDHERVSDNIRKQALINVWETSAWFAARDQPASAAYWYWCALKLNPTSCKLWLKFAQALINAILPKKKP